MQFFETKTIIVLLTLTELVSVWTLHLSVKREKERKERNYESIVKLSNEMQCQFPKT